MSYRSSTQVVRAEVLCLNVQGNQAFMLGEIDPSKSSGTPEGATQIAFEALDERGGDGLSVFFVGPGPLGCNLQPFQGAPIARGSIVVHDNLP
jgi:uncharacterized Zn-binding protein involved in type VI secretion